jgi:branched-chain amino acid transport system substrate-binding protein
MTSEMTMSVMDEINKSGVLMISPTVSTNQLTGIDDNFIRVMSPIRNMTTSIAAFAADRLQLKTVGIIYDLSNLAYSEDSHKDFRSEFTKRGGTISTVQTYTSSAKVSFYDMAQSIVSASVDGVFITASALDTAMICQQFRKLGSDIALLSSGWAMTNDFIQHGGSAAEGVYFSHGLDKNSRRDAYISFNDRFFRRFGKDPDFAAMFGYEAANVIVTGLSENRPPESLKETILRIKHFKGLQEDFVIDSYGDAHRSMYLISVVNGEYKVIGSVDSSDGMSEN